MHEFYKWALDKFPHMEKILFVLGVGTKVLEFIPLHLTSIRDILFVLSVMKKQNHPLAFLFRV